MSISHRKVTKDLRITDSNGNVISGQRVNITQTNHEFLFGCGAFMALGAANPDPKMPFADKVEEAMNFACSSRKK